MQVHNKKVACEAINNECADLLIKASKVAASANYFQMPTAKRYCMLAFNRIAELQETKRSLLR
jgi:hypothetical protein